MAVAVQRQFAHLQRRVRALAWILQARTVTASRAFDIAPYTTIFYGRRPMARCTHAMCRLLVCGCVAALSGCTSGTYVDAPIEYDRNAQQRTISVTPTARREAGLQSKGTRLHRVRRGETLYSIAWNYGLDYRDLARWNLVEAPFTIYPGQPLTLFETAARLKTERAASPAAPQVNHAVLSPRPRPKSAHVVARAANQPRAPAPKPERNRPVSQWVWPADGRVIKSFKATGRNGIDIAGKAGQAVRTTAAGRVVYSGSGLRGYGRLIIVKHNKRYLSAYAHNKKLHVAEGDDVTRGQRIAEMGDTGANRVMLHFEIRRDGKPVDPISYLPPEPG
jgi:lipoprotein NlpD